MGKTGCSSSTAYNFWDYYLLKGGLRKNASIALKTEPDRIILNIGAKGIKLRKGLYKRIFAMVNEKRLEYYGHSGKMVVYSADRSRKKECSLNIGAVETVEKMLNAGVDFEEAGEDLFLVEIVKGVRFYVRKTDPSDFQILEENFLHDQYEDLYKYLNGSIVLDIGANVADTAVLFCLKGAKKVFAYEPHPEVYGLAVRNIGLNGLSDRIAISRLGSDGDEKTVSVREHSFGADKGSEKRREDYCAKETHFRTIPFTRILDETGPVDLLKMDCEGGEFGSILKCPSAYLRRIRLMQIEYHDDPKPLIDHLKGSGFDVTVKNAKETDCGCLGLIFAARKEQ